MDGNQAAEIQVHALDACDACDAVHRISDVIAGLSEAGTQSGRAAGTRGNRNEAPVTIKKSLK
jgi:hypothetical protein